MNRDCLLDDAQIMHFINHGYHLVELDDLGSAFHANITEECSSNRHDVGNGIYDSLTALRKVYEHPLVHGALVSLLGEDMVMNPHRHLHTTPAHFMNSQTWHQDGTNFRHNQIRMVLAMYYPQDVTLENGPTVILPGSHLRNAPTDRMATYSNIQGQVFLTIKAGTVAITHYDIWHAATLNRSDRPRHMLKFLFDRKSEPVKPSWNHDPINGPKIAMGLIPEMVGPPSGYTSDYYKEWELRNKMWNWLLGQELKVGARAFIDSLG